MAPDSTVGGALWHGQAHMPTAIRERIVIERGEGAWLQTEDGRRLLDLPAALWYCSIGHGRREIGEAVAEQMGRVAAYTNFQQYATRPGLELAERIAALAPVQDARVFFGSGGSDAVEIAAKLARRYWAAREQPGKQLLISRTRSYHGLHGFGTSIGGLEPNRVGYGPLMPSTERIAWDDPSALEEAIARHGADRVAAFFCEPVIGTGGVLAPPPGYLHEVARICREHDVLLVVDEVITGFGRTGALFASERFGLQPDMLLFAKGVTAGYLPLGGVVVSGRVAEPFWAPDTQLIFRHGLTYQAHASACAAAHATLDVLEREGLVARVAELEPVLSRLLAPLAELPGVVEVRSGTGLLGAIQLRDAQLVQAVLRHCLANGLLTRPIGDGDTLQVSPPFVVEEHELARAFETIGEALAQHGETSAA